MTMPMRTRYGTLPGNANVISSFAIPFQYHCNHPSTSQSAGPGQAKSSQVIAADRPKTLTRKYCNTNIIVFFLTVWSFFILLLAENITNRKNAISARFVTWLLFFCFVFIFIFIFIHFVFIFCSSVSSKQKI